MPLRRKRQKRQIAPGAAGAQDVEDRIENGTKGVGWRPAAFGQGRKMALQRFPLRVGKIAWITGPHPFSLSHVRSFAHLQNTLLAKPLLYTTLGMVSIQKYTPAQPACQVQALSLPAALASRNERKLHLRYLRNHLRCPFIGVEARVLPLFCRFTSVSGYIELSCPSWHRRMF